MEAAVEINKFERESISFGCLHFSWQYHITYINLVFVPPICGTALVSRVYNNVCGTKLVLCGPIMYAMLEP